MLIMAGVVTNIDYVETKFICAIKEEKHHMELQILAEDEHNFNQSFKLDAKASCSSDNDVEDIKVKLEHLTNEEIDIKDEIMEIICTDNICDLQYFEKSYIRSSRSKRFISNGEERYKCKICNLQCAQKSNLQKHLRTHTGEKPFKCNRYDYRGSQNGHLQRHLKTHTGEKPYQCSICFYTCARKGDLQLHLRTHTGEKPYKCNICDYEGARTSNLKRHIRKHIRN